MMYTWAKTADGAPFQRIECPLPVPSGSQVLVRNIYAGVCHSDIHLWKGLLKTRKLPCTLGHEMEGELVSHGPDVEPGTLSIGKRYLVFPWIGCGTRAEKCKCCQTGLENTCLSGAPERFTDGNSIYGGYASHVLVPHPQYLIDSAITASGPEGLACTYMCSGLTVFSALKKIHKPPTIPHDLLVIGCGGLGLQAIQFANFLFGGLPCAADVSPQARQAAEAMGCKVYDPSEEDLVKKLIEETRGGFSTVIDCVGSTKTFEFAKRVVVSGGTIIIVGLFGGVTKILNVEIPVRALRIQGSLVGTLAEAHEMLCAVQGGAIKPIPHQLRNISDINQVFSDLENGRIQGRCILRHEGVEHSTL